MHIETEITMSDGTHATVRTDDLGTTVRPNPDRNLTQEVPVTTRRSLITASLMTT
jgi:hypothetical protein